MIGVIVNWVTINVMHPMMVAQRVREKKVEVKHTRACKSVLGNMRSSPAVGELGANFYFTRYTVEAE